VFEELTGGSFVTDTNTIFSTVSGGLKIEKTGTGSSPVIYTFRIKVITNKCAVYWPGGTDTIVLDSRYCNPYQAVSNVDLAFDLPQDSSQYQYIDLKADEYVTFTVSECEQTLFKFVESSGVSVGLEEGQFTIDANTGIIRFYLKEIFD